MSIQSEQELEAMRRVGRVTRLTLERMRDAVRPGITTAELDDIARSVMEEHGAQSAPRLFYRFPGWTCISINDEVVHGIPGSRAIREGDLVTLDVTPELDGYVADAAITVAVPPVSPLAAALCACAEAAFYKGAALARAGAPLSLVGGAVEREVKRRGFRVLRELSGHGTGRKIHEPPSVLNYHDERVRTRLTEGLVIALEPLIAATTSRTRTLSDGWTISSGDGSLTAHFEHTLVVRRGEPLLLTAA
jgi:methionyl aminopeptidase